MPEDATNTAEATAVTAAAYLKSHPFHHESVQRWPVQGDLRVRLSLTAALPPADVTSSIQAIVLGDGELRGQVLFLWPHNRGGDIAHVLIGGRQDPGETHHQTAVREVAEETGWLVTPLHMVGFRHFHHLEPWRAESDRPYLDFIQPVYAARAVAHRPNLAIPADLTLAGFLPVAEAIASTESGQRPLLLAAIQANETDERSRAQASVA